MRERKSRFIEPFWKDGEKPKGVLCCQFYEAKWSNGCVFACEYCYLRGTFRWQGWKGRSQTVFTNVDELKNEVDEFLNLPGSHVLHTGEVADSLAVPGTEELMGSFVESFGEQKRHTLLLLTKSDNVGSLLNLEHNDQTVIGFSINPSVVSKQFEIGAASTRSRLRAAKRCSEAGYRVMVRVDPIIPVPNWRKHYRKLFDELNALELYGVVVGTLRAFNGLRISLGSELKSYLTNRDVDGRWHIPHDLRLEIYKMAFQELRFKRMGVCKESGETWSQLISEFRDKRFFCNCRLQN